MKERINNTKIYVWKNSKDIQEKALSLWYNWFWEEKKVRYLDAPFLYFGETLISWWISVSKFNNCSYNEIFWNWSNFYFKNNFKNRFKVWEKVRVNGLFSKVNSVIYSEQWDIRYFLNNWVCYSENEIKKVTKEEEEFFT